MAKGTNQSTKKDATQKAVPEDSPQRVLKEVTLKATKEISSKTTKEAILKAQQDAAQKSTQKSAESLSKISQHSRLCAESPNLSQSSQSQLMRTQSQQPQICNCTTCCAPTQHPTTNVDSAQQLRSTLAIGHLLATKTPSAGSKLIAQELRQFSSSMSQEFGALRKEISQLPNKIASSLKTVIEEDRNDQRNTTGTRSFFGSLPRRLPIFRRPRRVSLMFARKSAPTTYADAATSTSPSANAGGKSTTTGTGAANKTAKGTSSDAPQNNQAAHQARQLGSKQPADLVSRAAKVAEADRQQAPMSPDAAAARFALTTVFKHIWLPPLDNGSNGYEGEAESESSDTPPPGSP